ncbi:hypothetical protein E6O75_ATG03793 [Venturia nashicola]|uniref:Uncharacterized protein n=1 Tax=Venturia nashicola TaxID=86259 RepID=A0A4Z1PPT1_9PEZI|nr:hypothetical protein E6O75_ATG03793 [Venturia nashicola]
MATDTNEPVNFLSDLSPRRWASFQTLVLKEVPEWTSSFTCKDESLDFRASIEWLRDKRRSGGHTTRLKAPLYWINVAEYVSKVQDLTGFTPLATRKALFYDNFPREGPAKEAQSIRGLNKWVMQGDLMIFMLKQVPGFLLYTSILTQAELEVLQKGWTRHRKVDLRWVPEHISQIVQSLSTHVIGIVERMRDVQAHILTPGYSLFSNMTTRQHLDSQDTRLPSDSVFAIAESLSCFGQNFPSKLIEHAGADCSWGTHGNMVQTPSRINFEAVSLLEKWGLITQFDEHGLKCPIRQRYTMKLDEMAMEGEDAEKWEGRQRKLVYRRNFKDTGFFPHSVANATRFLNYSLSIDVQIAANWAIPRGRVMIPYLERCLEQFPWEQDGQTLNLEPIPIIENVVELYRFIQVLTFASSYGSSEFKRITLDIASRLCARLPESMSEVMSLHVHLRRWAVQRLYYCFDRVRPLEDIKTDLDYAVASDLSSRVELNVLIGQYALRRSQEAMDAGELQSALVVLDEYVTLDTPREGNLRYCVSLAKGNVLRLQGDFHGSREFYWQAATQCTNTRMQRFGRKLAAVACEIGKFGEAFNHVSWGQSVPALIETEVLALADNHFMLGLWKWRQHLNSNLRSDLQHGAQNETYFGDAASHYRSVADRSSGANQAMTATRNRTWALIALAVISHVCNEPEAAERQWYAALDAVKDCSRYWMLHYVHAIILYSLADLAVHDVHAASLIKSADSIYSKRQMYFSGLGTVWPDILCIRAHKARRVLALSNSASHMEKSHTASIALGWHPNCCSELPIAELPI